MDDAAIRALRMKAHGLTGDAASTSTALVSTLLAVQAQNLRDASWSIGLRVPGTTAASIAVDIAQGALVRTWTMRGTLHVVNASDVRWLLGLAGPRARATRSRAWHQAELDEQVFENARKVATQHLEGGRRLSRTALVRAFNEAGIVAAGERGSHIIRYLAETCAIVPGPPDGTTSTFGLFDDWVPSSAEISRDESLRTLAVRYIQGHGPATVRDLAWWSGLTIGDARRALNLAGEQLAEFVAESETYYLLPDLFAEGAGRDDERPAIHLIPGFDEYHIGYATRRHILEDVRRHILGPAKNGLFKNPILLDGSIEGTWSRASQRKTLTLEMRLFDSNHALGPDALSPAALEPSRIRYEHLEARPTELRIQASWPET